MIVFGTKYVTLGPSWKNTPKEQIKGYYLVINDDRFFISECIDSYKLEVVASKRLNDKTGYNYWIDYCYGFGINGNLAWMNLDNTDNFI